MAKSLIRKPRCAECPHCNYHSGPVAQKVKGAFLKVGSRYCTGGGKIKVFKRSDPKVYVPSWCPRQKSPADLRIYCYKDSTTWYLRYLLDRDGVAHVPSGYEYALRYEGSTELTARDFEALLQEKSVWDILDFEVRKDEVIEIDDGLIPYYFYVREYGVDVLHYFDRDWARRNHLEESSGDE